MSKINIQGLVDNIKSRTNAYTPLVEAVVNSIDSIRSKEITNGLITIKVKRENTIGFDGSLPNINSLEVIDNGVGFTNENRESFDTLYSTYKKIKFGSKGFGRVLYRKYFSEIQIQSNYKEEDDKYYYRDFYFGNVDQIIVKEKVEPSVIKKNATTLFLNNLRSGVFDKELETIARKLLEKLLIFFIDEKFTCPIIVLQEYNGSKQIIINDYLKSGKEIALVDSRKFTLSNNDNTQTENFMLKIFKLFYSKTDSKVILAANNREVTETSLHDYIPEFEDEFYDVNPDGKGKRNYIIKTYVTGTYLNDHVSLERESFDLPKEEADQFNAFSISDIEREATTITKQFFEGQVKIRSDKKKIKVFEYVNSSAPWHKPYINDVDLSQLPYNLSEEVIELELQRHKFQQEQETRTDLKLLVNSTEKMEFNERVEAIIEKVTEIGKGDLAHYVSTRKVVLQVLDELRKRDDYGKASLENELHSLIYPMNRDSTNTNYSEHNLWLLDERLVFSEYVASDKKISKKVDALDEPDLLVFDVKRAYRGGENEYSNPITIFEFKRPKRTAYSQDEDPIIQIGRYLDKIRLGKLEMPEGLEPIKVNDNTPVYAYVVCDLADKIHEFARNHSLVVSPDNEGYFGFHPGFRMYIEIISFKKLAKDAKLRNKIFFKKLKIE